MKTNHILASIVIAAACITPTMVSANVVEHVTMDFQSGATFMGDVTFTDDLSRYTAVSGTLSGGAYGTDSINWVWSTTNQSGGADNFSNWLMDGTNQGNYSHFIQLAVNYSNPEQLVFTSGVSLDGTDNYVNYSDAFVSGTISSTTAVPEAGTWAMLGLGLAAIGAISRKKRVRSAALAA